MKTNTPLKAIHRNCVECMGGNRSLVKGCSAPSCPLFRFREGRTYRGMSELALMQAKLNFQKRGK
ncbi:MAG: hypothetical protein JNL74_23765 [Fibrobacteres bacterium]|nr:hypothetical protein [Fibrobacterota bacterium]